MSEWKETTLGAVCENKSITYNFSNKERVIFINTGDVLDGKFLHHEYTEISSLPGQAKKSIVKNDILFSEIRPINRRFAFINFSCLDYVVSTKFMVVKAYQNLIIPKYLYTYLTNQDLLNTFQSIAESRSGTFPQITFDSIKHLDLNLPPLEEQGRIVDIASCLNAKIDNLRRQNETLEQIAQTLFKHWFVDFEFPNADGKPYKSSGGAMFASELGDIPEGWAVGTLGDVAKNHSETHNFKGKNEIIFVNTGDVLEGNFLHKNYMPIDKLPGQAKKRIAKDDILYSEIRPKNKRFAYVNFNDNTENYVVSTKFMVVRANDLIVPRLLYLILKRQESIDEFNYIAESRSGTFPQITFEAISYFKFPLAPLKLQKYLMPLLTNLLEKKEFNISQIQTLTKTRDSLLPKLMSGQLRVKE